MSKTNPRLAKLKEGRIRSFARDRATASVAVSRKCSVCGENDPQMGRAQFGPIYVDLCSHCSAAGIGLFRLYRRFSKGGF